MTTAVFGRWGRCNWTGNRRRLLDTAPWFWLSGRFVPQLVVHRAGPAGALANIFL